MTNPAAASPAFAPERPAPAATMQSPASPSRQEVPAGPQNLSAPPFLIGAYAATAGELEWQEEFYELLAAEPWVGGLEIPYLAGGLREPAEWLAGQLVKYPAYGTNVLTPIGGVMSHIEDRSWGIASGDADGRAGALEFLRGAADAMRRVNDLAGRQAFAYLALHTSPQAEASPEAFERSLAEISSWDIDGAQLVVEHCDAWTGVPGHHVEKGFLKLEDELAVIKKVGAPNVAASLNWGRCAIEGEGAELPQRHIEQVVASGLLGGFILSGAQDSDDGQWGPWVDAHIGLREHQPASVLSRDGARAAFAAALAGGPAYIGAKISIGSGANAERVALLRELAELSA